MPIRRWHGWGAQCRRCHSFINLGEMEAWKEREHVTESLELLPGDVIEERIEEMCGCARRKSNPPKISREGVEISHA